MAQVVLGIAGLISGLTLGIIPLIPSIAPNGPKPGSDSIVRIGVALSGKGTGGNAPYIAAFNELGQYVGYNDKGSKIGYGSFSDLVINQHCKKKCKKGQQAPYLQLYGGKDGICMAYISQTWADGQKRGWLGDMAKVCNKAWYYSNITVELKDNKRHSPLCLWLKQDPPYPKIQVSAIQLHMPSFSGTSEYQLPSSAALCRKPATLTRYSKGKPKSTPRIWTSQTKRDDLIDEEAEEDAMVSPVDTSQFSDMLVMSHNPLHTATELCRDPLSHGPSLVSFEEGVYCDMETKTTWPLCTGSKNEAGCYDWKTHALVESKERKRDMRYSNIMEWS